MSDPFVGEIRAVAFNYAPEGWHLCDGTILQVGQYQALYALLGNRFGGTASTTFALPDLQGRSIVSSGNGAGLPPVVFAQKIGAASTTLATNQMPIHTHGIQVTDPGHSHSAALPAHTHSFAVPCDNAAGPLTPDPTNAYLSVTGNITTNMNAIGSAAAAGITGAGGTPSIPTIANNLLYAKSSNGTMGAGTTGAATASGSSATGTATTGVAAVAAPIGGNLPVATQTPALGLYYIIALTGIFPPRC